MERRVILTASSNTGIGLWTSICVGFCSILGTESKNYKKKQNKVLAAANLELAQQLKSLGFGYVLSDYRVTWSGKLSVTVSALAVDSKGRKEDVADIKVCPKCGAPIDDEMLFCGECGEKLK